MWWTRGTVSGESNASGDSRMDADHRDDDDYSASADTTDKRRSPRTYHHTDPNKFRLP